jgi:hypothetical protein
MYITHGGGRHSAPEPVTFRSKLAGKLVIQFFLKIIFEVASDKIQGIPLNTPTADWFQHIIFFLNIEYNF